MLYAPGSFSSSALLSFCVVTAKTFETTFAVSVRVLSLHASHHVSWSCTGSLSGGNRLRLISISDRNDVEDSLSRVAAIDGFLLLTTSVWRLDLTDSTMKTMLILRSWFQILPSTLYFFVRSDRHSMPYTVKSIIFSDWSSFCAKFSVLLKMVLTAYNYG